MTGGSINISRSLWSDAAFADEPFTEREAWAWMIAEASWKPREKRVGKTVVRTDRGQMAASVRFMAERWKWSKSRVHRYLGRLKNRDMIQTDSGTGLLLITICKYDEYQGRRDSSGTAAGRPAGQQRDSSGTNDKKGEIKDITLEANASNGASAVDATSEAIWKRGVPFLVEQGTPERQARSLIGKWLRDAGAPALFDAMVAAKKSGTGDPVPYITEALKAPPDVRAMVQDAVKRFVK